MIFVPSAISPFANLLFKKKGGYDFGDPDVTISYSLGKNKAMGKLMWPGSLLCGILDIIDPGHCDTAVIETELNKNKYFR